jgi:ATP-dependent DNA helicase PIF1
MQKSFKVYYPLQKHVTTSDYRLMNSNTELKQIIQYLKDGENVFITGAGGTGKSYTLMKIAKKIENVALTALTGIAAINIGGQTLHRFMGIGLGEGSKRELLEQVEKRRGKVRELKETQILVVDEISMLGAKLLGKIDFILRNIRKNNIIFGNMLVVFSADPLQLPPVNDEYCFFSDLWEIFDFKAVPFMESRRQLDEQFFKMLCRIRKCEHTKKDTKLLRSRLIKSTGTIEINGIRPTRLYSLRADVESYNMAELKKLPGDPVIFDAKDKKQTDKKDTVISNAERAVLDQGIPRIVTLKVGAQVILTKNIAVELQLANGSRGVVRDINEKKTGAYVDFLTQNNVFIARNSWKVQLNKKTSISRCQIPLILGYAITIHKSQSSTLDLVTANLDERVFANGQAYVALSRVRSLEGLFLTDFDEDCIKADEKVINFVNACELQK